MQQNALVIIGASGMAKKASIPTTKGYKIPITFYQPWSTFIMKTKLPPVILKKMIKITDDILSDKNSTPWGKNLAGQVNEEPLVENETIERAGLMPFFLDVVKKFAIQQTLQSNPFGLWLRGSRLDSEKSIASQIRHDYYTLEDIANDDWFTKMVSMWIVSQKDNEYNPCHTHTGCHISSVMYLKIPKYLKPRKEHEKIPNDGAITFFHNSAQDKIWGSTNMTVQPEVGDFFIFPASMIHAVYPFRTANKKGERRSVSFNSVFSSNCMPFVQYQTPEGNKFDSY